MEGSSSKYFSCNLLFREITSNYSNMKGQQGEPKVKKEKVKKTAKKVELSTNKPSKVSKAKKQDAKPVTQTKKKTEFEEVARPALLLQYLYFLNQSTNKYIAIGLIAENDFRPAIILASNLNYVVFSIPDWITLFSNYMYEPIIKWFEGDDGLENNLLIQKNFKVSNFKIPDKRMVMIENIPQNRLNNTMFLTQVEYNQCLAMNTYIQPLIKQMQQNSNMVRDYFDLYVGYCFCKNKFSLDDDEFFSPFDQTVNLDIYRVFKEIPLICEKKIKSEIEIIKDYSFE